MMEQQVVLEQSKDLTKEQTHDIIQTNHNITDKLIISDNALTVQTNNNILINKRQRLTNSKQLKALQQLMRKNKVKRLVENFAKKLKMNSVYRSPIENLEDHKYYTKTQTGLMFKARNALARCGSKKGLTLNNLALILWSLTNIIQTAVMVFIFSIMLVFPETQDFSVFLYLRLISFALYVIDMILSFVSQRYENGKRLQFISEIASYYVKHGCFVDLVSILIFPIDMFVNANVNLFFSFVYVIKLFSSLKKFTKFQCLVITNTDREQYYGLIKVFIMNFVIGHFLSILLNLMVLPNQQQNWIKSHNLLFTPWYIRYVWGYYWGTNIMLTVGFGDICATNQYEAFFLIFIQTFSCITLAYNISYVGAIIGLIREKKQSKVRKLKTFHLMCKQNEVPLQTESKLSNYIQEQFKIKQVYDRDAHDEVINSLPGLLQKQYRKEANKLLFDNLGFLNNLTKKTLLKLAEQVHRKVYHPEQIIIKRGQVTQFYILQKGSVQFICKIRSKLDGKPIQCLSVDEASHRAKLFSLNFLKSKPLPYSVKSVNYSILYYLQREEFKQVLRKSQMDYQLFCFLRDKDEYLVDQFNLYPCQLCQKQFHNKFECSKLHYIPIKINILKKHFQKQKKLFQKREKIQREKQIYSCLKNKKCISEEQEEYIQQNYDKQHYQYIKGLIQFYKNQEAPKNMKKALSHAFLQQLEINDKRKSKDNDYLKSTTDLLTLQKLEQLLDAKRKQIGFWELKIDIAQDFRYYFKQSNPENLRKIKKFKKVKFL